LTNGGSHQRQALLVQNERLACVDDDVAGIVGLSDPHGSCDAGNRKALAIINVEQFPVVEMNQQFRV
jgi:hypothetical protein